MRKTARNTRATLDKSGPYQRPVPVIREGGGRPSGPRPVEIVADSLGGYMERPAALDCDAKRRPDPYLIPLAN
jgi:hypothetical protein